MARSRFWSSLFGHWVEGFILVGICVPIGVIGIIPFFDWVQKGIWIWPTSDTVIYAAKLLIVYAPLLGTMSWILDKLKNRN